MVDSSRNRIPAKETAEYGSWQMPEINNGKVVEVVHSGDNQPNAATVQNVSVGSQKREPMTVEELENISRQAQQEGYQTGHEKGLKEGKEKGYQEGYAKSDREINQRVAQLQNLIAQLMLPINEQDEQIEQVMLALVKSTTQVMIQRELEESRVTLMRRIINDAIAVLPMGSKSIQVYLSPDDFAAIEGDGGDHSSEWQLQVDETLQAGDCRVETAQSLVDYTMNDRLDCLMEKLIDNAEGSSSESVKSVSQSITNSSSVSTPGLPPGSSA